MAETIPTKVFISYSHDSSEHMDRVLDLSDRLRRQGIDCELDQYEMSPEDGWPTWVVNRFGWADFVLVICTETYERRFSKKEEKGVGSGVKWEGAILTQELYDAESKNSKFIPVVFETKDAPHIPITLRGPTRYDLSDTNGYATLYRHLTNQPLVRKPELGLVVDPATLDLEMPVQAAPLPVRPRKQDFLKLSNLPLPRNPYFTGREDKLERLRNGFNPSRKSAVPIAQAISGMGGTGKTQLALEYAYLHEDEYRALLWVQSDSKESLTGGFWELAKLLNLPEKDAKDQGEAVAAVKRWLAREENWLLILDNTDDLQLAKEFVPTKGEGHVLLTVQADVTGTLAARVEIVEMDESEGALFLLRRLGVVPMDGKLEDAPSEKCAQAEEFVKELGGLPLALDQAVAYIEELSLSFPQYLGLYREEEGPRLRADRGERPSDHPHSVTVTVRLSFDKVSKASEAAADLLRVCAFLAPDAIPEEVFTKGRLELGESLNRVLESRLGLMETIRELRRYSLLRRNPDEETLRIHRTVQAVIKDMMDEPAQRFWAERAVRAANQAFPDVEYANWKSCERLVPQAAELKRAIDKWELETAESGRLLDQTGWYLTERAAYVEAEPLFKRSLEIREKALGAEHPDVAMSLNNLAGLYRGQGKYEEAEPLLKRSLEIREKALGAEHPDVAISLNNLAALYQNQRKYKEAEPLLKRSLEIREKVLGAEHPDVAFSLNNLAISYQKREQYTNAEPLLKRSLEIREKALGEKHPDVAQSLNNLATLYSKQGNYIKAEPLYKRALAIEENALGALHPNFAKSLFNLGFLYANQRKTKVAEPMLKRALKISEKALGDEHPETLEMLEKFADFLRAAGKKREEREVKDRVKSIKVKLSRQNQEH